MWSWLVDALRSVFFFLDGLVYNFIVTLYNLLVDIAETSIFTEEVIDLFASKVYALLGIFMLFKVSFSILSYIVNPDDFLDKTKGFSKLISNIIITLTLLLATPWIFSQAMDIQRIILRDNILGKIFSTSETNSVVVNDPGNTMASETFKAFYHVDTDVFPECDGIHCGDNKECLEDYPTANEANCETNAFNGDEENFENFKDTLVYSYKTGSISIYMNSDFLNQKGTNDSYVMSYLPFISTLGGGAVALLLIVFCFDVAVRSVKLGFLRMLAPIPIVSRIDPKKGTETFNKWVGVCVKTYLDLFIRLLAIYFAVFVITQVIDLRFVDAVTGLETEVNVFVKVFIIIGALLFAKQLPQLIQDITGVKMDGKFTMNPMNKVRQTPLLGAGLTSAAAMAGGAYAGFKAGRQAGAPMRGVWQGMMGSRREVKGKVPLMGDDKGGKSTRPFHTGIQSGYKTITGKDYGTFDPWKVIGSKSGAKKVDEYKQSKYALQGQQAALDAELQTLYDQLKNTNDPERRKNLTADIEANRSQYGKISKHISVIDDQIKDVKRLYHIDDSPQKDLEAAMAAASAPRVENSVNSTQSTSSTPHINTASADTTVTTPSGKTVNVKAGEQHTDSGIIIGNDSNWNKK